MEIEIKTLDESRAVYVRVDGARLYTPAEVGDAQAGEAELVAAPLRDRVRELEVRISELSGSLFTARQGLSSESRRADSNRMWAARAEAVIVETEEREETLKFELACAKDAIKKLSVQIGQISSVVHSPDLAKAMSLVYMAPETTALRDAVRDVRGALGLPDPV